MNLYTSYYRKNGNNPKAVSIAGKAPVWYKGREYKDLAPKYWFFKKYKKDLDEEFYTKQYYAEVLDNLDLNKVLEDIGDGAILLCWESSEKFCHRHIVAEWLRKKEGVEVKEL